MDVDAFLRELENRRGYRGQMVHVQGVPEECLANHIVGSIRDGSPAWGAVEGEMWETLAQARDNHQRHRVHRFKPIKTHKLRVLVRKTRGDKAARMYGVRVYGKQA